MNINALRKNYDKLTARERFAAIVAAGLRDDAQEQDALAQSAPVKTFAVKHHYGLSTAFDRLGMFYRILQLADAGLIMLAIGIGDNTPDPDIFSQAIEKISEHYLTGAAAWTALCAEYGIDPKALTDGLPGDDVLYITTRFCDVVQDGQDLPELQECLDALRGALVSMVGKWE